MSNAAERSPAASAQQCLTAASSWRRPPLAAVVPPWQPPQQAQRGAGVAASCPRTRRPAPPSSWPRQRVPRPAPPSAPPAPPAPRRAGAAERAARRDRVSAAASPATRRAAVTRLVFILVSEQAQREGEDDQAAAQRAPLAAGRLRKLRRERGRHLRPATAQRRLRQRHGAPCSTASERARRTDGASGGLQHGFGASAPHWRGLRRECRYEAAQRTRSVRAPFVLGVPPPRAPHRAPCSGRFSPPPAPCGVPGARFRSDGEPSDTEAGA